MGLQGLFGKVYTSAVLLAAGSAVEPCSVLLNASSPTLQLEGWGIQYAIVTGGALTLGEVSVGEHGTVRESGVC